MTIRSEINRKKEIFGITIVSGIILFIVGIMTVPHFSIIGIAVSFLGFLLLLYRIKCPNCKNAWGYVMYSGSPFSISRKMKYCPYCGEDIDKNLDLIKSRNKVML